MFHVPGILNTSHRSKLTRCWLAGTVSERVFKRKVNKHQITEYQIEEYCEEILRIFNDKRMSKRWHFGLHLFSHLMFGVVRLYSYQFILFENSVFSVVNTLDDFDCGILPSTVVIAKQSTKRGEHNQVAQLAEISQIPIDELLMPLTPELNLNRPFGRDINLLYEMSPASHRRMTELDELSLVRFSPLTESQAKRWLSNDEGCLWTNVNTCRFPELELRPSDVELIHPAAMEAARPDSPSRVLRTPKKRTSTQKNVDTPSKRQRPSQIQQIDTMGEEAVIPMEHDGEPLPLPVEPMVAQAPGDPMAPVDQVPALFPMEQDIEPYPLPEHQVALVDKVPDIFPMEQDIEPHPLPQDQVVPVAPVHQVENATDVGTTVQPVKSARRLRYRGKKFKIVDAIKTISEVKLNRREQNVQAYTEPPATTRSVPTKKLVRTLLQLPSTIFIFGMENIRYTRLRKVSDELLRRHEIKICGPSDVENDSSNFRPRDLPRRRTDDALTVLGNETETGRSTENGTVIQPFEVTVAPPDEVPQAEATDEPAFDVAGGAQFPLGDIEQTGHSVNTSDATTVIVDGVDTGKSTENLTVIRPTKLNVTRTAEAPQAEAANEPAFDPTSETQLPLGNIDKTEHSENTSDMITASFKRVKISTDATRSKTTDRRGNSPCTDWTIHYSPWSKEQVTVEKSEKFILDNSSQLSSPRSGVAANTVWTRKDLEANLEVHWHDNNIISFEQIAPSNETSDADATVCFMILLDLYKENKVILTQARTDAPIYIEKGVISDAMDWT